MLINTLGNINSFNSLVTVQGTVNSTLKGFNQGLTGSTLNTVIIGTVNSTLIGFNQGLLGSVSSNSVTAVVSSNLSGFNQGLIGTLTGTSVDVVVYSVLSGFNQGLVATATYQQHTAVIGSVLTGFRQYSVAIRTEALTFRKAILNASGLPQGATLREHLKNLIGTFTVPVHEFTVDHKIISTEVDLVTTTLLVNHDKPAYSVEFIENGSTVDINVTPVVTTL